MVTLNLRHAINDYGILDSNLPTQVLAQTNNSGGGTSGDGGGTSNNGGDSSGGDVSNDGGDSSGGLPAIYIKSDSECVITFTGEAGISIVFKGITYTIPAKGKLTIGFGKAAVDCAGSGTQMCIYSDCNMFYSN
jgi:hypothetical protein